MHFITGGKGSWDSGRIRELLAVDRIRQPLYLSRYTEMLGVERHHCKSWRMSWRPTKSISVWNFLRLSRIKKHLRADFGLFFKFIVFEPQSQSEPLLVAPHPFFKDSAAASDDGLKPFYFLLTNVGKL
jgi:hypothetical protein